MVATLVFDAAQAVLARLAAYASAQGVTLNYWGPDSVPPYPSGGTDAEQAAYYPYGVCWTWQRTDTSRRRLSDDSLTRPFRVVTQFVGSTAGEAQFIEDCTDQALRGARLSISGFSTTPCHHEAMAGIAPDSDLEELFSGSAAWTFTATPTP